MKTPNLILLKAARWIGLVLVFCGLLVPSGALAGTWTPLNNKAPGSVMLMLLLSDGTVLCMNNTDAQNAPSTSWYRLTPTNGSYVNGTWTTLTSANDARLFFASQVLTNGEVFVAGGEYYNGGPQAELFNPLANNGAGSWTQINPPLSLMNPSEQSPALASGNQSFLDSISEIVANGNVLIAPVGPNVYGGTLIYSQASNSWVQGPQLYRGAYQDEASWVKLPDNSIITIDPYGENSERYIDSSNQWVNDANTGIPMYDSAGGELGAAFLLPNKKAFFLGATGNTALYTQSPLGGTNFGSWGPGPGIPSDGSGNALAAQDSPAAMMADGNILCEFGHLETNSGGSPSPGFFFEYNYASGTNGSFTQVNGPTGVSFNDSPGGTYSTTMLDLPDGTVLFCGANTTQTFGEQLYVYSPGGTPLAAGQPVIYSITLNMDGSYTLVGTGLNGISQGAAFGDDAQMNSNYPLVRMTNTTSGSVYYARTYNWSSTGVMTGSALVSTQFTVPTNLPPGTYSLVVTANGIASASVTFEGPVWVDFNYSGTQTGTYQYPWETLASGVSHVASGGPIFINASVQPSTSTETMTITKPMTITSVGGPSTIGD